jgi:hypothetical protein
MRWAEPFRVAVMGALIGDSTTSRQPADEETARHHPGRQDNVPGRAHLSPAP